MTKVDVSGRLITKVDVSEALMNSAEVAKFLRISEATLPVWRCRDPQKLPFVKCGKAVRYRRSDVLQFVARNLVGSND
jgi:predicted DNA-binding transcriptional regulator AlpA